MNVGVVRVPSALFAVAIAVGTLIGCDCLSCGFLSRGQNEPTPVTLATLSAGRSPTQGPWATGVPTQVPPVVVATLPPGGPTATRRPAQTAPAAFATLPSGVPVLTARPTTVPSPPPTPRPTAAPPALTQFLCCGTSAGGTYVWGVNYPAGWQVTYIPNDHQNYTGVVISDPQGSIAVALIPSAMTPSGTPLDTGDVDEFLNAYRAQRQQENPGFTEFLRQPVKDVAEGRVWAGTWGSGSGRMWVSYLVVVYSIQAWTPGLPRGYLTLLGLQASSPEWSRGVATYESMLASVQMRKVSGGDNPPAGAISGAGGLAVKPFLIRWCPNCCDWVAVTADSENWACPVCGTPTELWETPCQ